MAFKSLFNFCTTIGCSTKPSDVTLPLSDAVDAQLCGLLGTDTSTLMLSDAFNYEIVGVKCTEGQVVFTRGQEGTIARNWGCGAKLSFEWTNATLLAALNQAKAEEGSEDGQALCGVASESLEITFEDGECIANIELKTGETASWKACGNKYTFGPTGVEVEAVPAGERIADGVYKNAQITVVNGCIVAISEGTNLVYSSCGNCCG